MFILVYNDSYITLLQFMGISLFILKKSTDLSHIRTCYHLTRRNQKQMILLTNVHIKV